MLLRRFWSSDLFALHDAEVQCNLTSMRSFQRCFSLSFSCWVSAWCPPTPNQQVGCNLHLCIHISYSLGYLNFYTAAKFQYFCGSFQGNIQTVLCFSAVLRMQRNSWMMLTCTPEKSEYIFGVIS